jgi:hypothetical protein
MERNMSHVRWDRLLPVAGCIGFYAAALMLMLMMRY